MKCSLGISNFLEEISRLSHSMVRLLLLLSSFSHVWLCATPWTVAFQAPPSMGFSRQEYWSGVPSPSMSHSIVVLYFFALITEEGFLISPCYSLELCNKMGISFLLSLLFSSLLFTAICKASSESHCAFLHFFFLVMVLIPVSCTCHEPPSIVHQALCLSNLVPSIYFSLPLYNHKGFDLGHTWMV